MTEIGAEKEKAPEQGENKLGKPGATMFSFSGYTAIGLLLVVAIRAFTGNASTGQTGFNPVLLVVALPLVIGSIQRTNSDQLVTWHKWEARIAGFVVGALSGLILA